MPIIYLRHPVHGTKIASLDMEAEFDEENGWERYNPEEPVESARVEEPPAKRKYTRKAVQPFIEQPNEVRNFLASVSDESEET
jgi:hypothetical protein